MNPVLRAVTVEIAGTLFSPTGTPTNSKSPSSPVTTPTDPVRGVLATTDTPARGSSVSALITMPRIVAPAHRSSKARSTVVTWPAWMTTLGMLLDQYPVRLAETVTSSSRVNPGSI